MKIKNINLVETPIKFNNSEEVQKAFDLGIINCTCGYVDTEEEKGDNSDSFPTVFWLHSGFTTEYHQPKFLNGDNIWNELQYRRLLENAIDFPDIEKHIKNILGASPEEPEMFEYAYKKDNNSWTFHVTVFETNCPFSVDEMEKMTSELPQGTSVGFDDFKKIIEDEGFIVNKLAVFEKNKMPKGYDVVVSARGNY